MKKSLILPIKSAGALSLLLLLLSCNSKETAQQPAAVSVRTQKIIYDNNLYQQEYIGTVESENAVDISFLVPGNIEVMYAAEGQKVSKGQVLAKLNSATLKNSHDAASASLKQTQDAFKRLSAMYESSSLPEVQYVDVKTKVEQARASEAIAKKNLMDCVIYAPHSGVIGRRYLEPGANVMPGTPVYNIMDISSVKVRTAIPEGEISSMIQGAECRVEISALGDTAYNGKIVEKGVAANPVSHTYDIKIRIANPSGSIAPGMVCRTYLNNSSDTSGQSIIIPIKAVQVDFSGKRFVWIMSTENRALKKNVVLGSLSENGVKILEGLQQGDELITAGYQKISEGTLVAAVKN